MPPTGRLELAFARRLGVSLVAGVDEAGRGPLAGPVVAAAVIWAPETRRPRGIDDSKKLTHARRVVLFDLICASALSFGIGEASVEEIEAINILEATRLAARRALAQLAPQPEALITDALRIPGETRPILAVIKGDAKSASIAAASILAKVTRDRRMAILHEEFPEFNWAKNQGYPTADHYAAIEAHGPTSFHRFTFRGVRFLNQPYRRSRSCLALNAALDDALVRQDAMALQEIRTRLDQPSPLFPDRDREFLLEQLASAHSSQGSSQ